MHEDHWTLLQCINSGPHSIRRFLNLSYCKFVGAIDLFVVASLDHRGQLDHRGLSDRLYY